MTHNVFDNAEHSVPVYAYDQEGNKVLLGRANVDENGEANIKLDGPEGEAFKDFLNDGTLHEVSINAVTWTDDDEALNVKNLMPEADRECQFHQPYFHSPKANVPYCDACDKP